MLGTPWGRITIVSRERSHPVGGLDLVAWETDDGAHGILGLDVKDGGMEVVILHAESTCTGLGRVLMEHAREKALSASCNRLWLVTTNANVNAQGFYEHLGLRRCAIHAGAIELMRRMKPLIPTHDEQGTPIRDEFEYEWRTM